MSNSKHINLGRYRDALGEPGKGFHKRVLGVPMKDYFGTLLIGVLLSLINAHNRRLISQGQFWLVLVAVLTYTFYAFVIGEMMHLAFGVQTQLLVACGFYRLSVTSHEASTDRG